MYKASNIKIKSNYVLIKPEKDIEQLKSGLYIMAGAENLQKGLANTEARHYNITGTVLVAPDKLIFRGKQVANLRKRTRGIFNDYDIKALQAYVSGSMHYQSDVEVQAGDKVWFDYIAHLNAVTDQKIIHIEGHGECILLDYDQLFIRDREGVRTPINGHVFVRKIINSSDALKNLGLYIPKSSSETTVRNQAEVIMIGKPHDQYLSAKHTDYWFQDMKVGDKIIYNEAIATPLEYEIHATEGLEKLWKIKRKDIKAIFTDEEMKFDSFEDSDIKLSLPA